MASGDTDLVKALLAEAPVKTAHAAYKNKRVRQLLDAYLEHGTRLAPAGTLAYTLYTFVPNPGRSLTTSWTEVEREWIALKLALESLGTVGVLCAFLGLETHPPETKKGKKKPDGPAAKKRRGGDPNPEEEEDLEQEDLDVPAPPPPGPAGSGSTEEATSRLHPQALKPHFHALLVHDLTDGNLRDAGYLNRWLAEKDRAAADLAGAAPRFQDVQAKPVSLRKHGPTNSICYIFKASGDKLTEFLARKFCPSWTRPLVHLIYPPSSRLWTRSSMQQMIRLCNLYDPSLQLAANAAALPPPGLWAEGEEYNESITLPSSQHRVAMRIGVYLRQEGIYYCDGHFMDLEPGTRAVGRLRYKSLAKLLKAMIRLPAYQTDLFRFHGQLLKMELWAVAASFPQRTVAYDTFELEDCFMRHGRRDAPVGGRDPWFAFVQEMPHETFAALKVPLRRDQCHFSNLYEKNPVAPDIRVHCPKWWAVITNAFRHMSVPTDLELYARDRKSVEKLICMLAHSLCRQNPKEKVPFLLGLSNTGKSTVVEPMYRLYGESLKSVVQDSAFPLEKVPFARYMVFEEFRLDTLPSNTLFQLLEHGQVNCDIKGKTASEVTCDFGMAACSNRYPKFPDRSCDLQVPLDNRLEYFLFDYPIPNMDSRVRDHIKLVETPYALMFMIMVYHGMESWV